MSLPNGLSGLITLEILLYEYRNTMLSNIPIFKYFLKKHFLNDLKVNKKTNLTIQWYKLLLVYD